MTIDPASARDHDDAVYVEDAGQGALRLWVAIADVSPFVPEGGAVAREARRRGNRGYLPDRAIPTLPESLSSGACSLVEGEERLVLAVELSVDRAGRVRSSARHRARSRSRARLAYEEAARLMARDGPTAELVGPLRRLAEVAERLRRPAARDLCRRGRCRARGGTCGRGGGRGGIGAGIPEFLRWRHWMTDGSDSLKDTA